MCDKKIDVNWLKERQLLWPEKVTLTDGNKGNNKITEHRAIFQRERQNSCQQTNKISQQPENWENRNVPDLVQAFPKKWWVKYVIFIKTKVLLPQA